MSAPVLHVRRGGAAPLLVAILLASATRAGEPALSPEVSALPPEEQATWIVRSIREPEPPLAEPAPLLAEVGRGVPDHLIGMLRARVVPALGDGKRQTMSIYQRALLRDALDRLGPDVVLPAATRSLKTADEPLASAAFIEVLGLVGTADDLDLVRKRARPLLASDGELPPRLEEAVEDAVADLAASDPETHVRLVRAWRSWPRELLPALLRGVGRARDPRGLPTVTEVVSWHEDLAVLGLSQVRLLGPSADDEVNQETAEVVRELVRAEDLQVARAALLALGELEDVASIPAMIELLGEDSGGLAENALWALRRISGLKLNENRDLWRAWYRQEERWFEEDAPRAIERLRSPLDHQVAAAVREIGNHRLHRHELARELAPVLEHPQATLRALACRALARLGSLTALADLAHALRDAEEEVFQAASRALVVLTGRDLGTDPDDWLALLEG